MARKNDYIDIVDKFIGNKIYSLRLAQGLSRMQLVKIIAVTHIYQFLFYFSLIYFFTSP
jgi:hypothetical protein